MPNLTTSTSVDNFLQATSQSGMREALGSVPTLGANTFTGLNVFPSGLWAHIGNDNGVSIGYFAGGTYSSNTSDQIAIGFFAGAGSTTAGSTSSVRIGRHAGYASIGPQQVCVGHAAGQYAYSSNNSVIIGYLAARNPSMTALHYTFSSVIIGHETALNGVNNQTATIIGAQAGRAATNSVGSTIIGYAAGQNATNSAASVMLGNYAGWNSTNAVNSVLIGNRAGYSLSRSHSLVIESNPSFSDAGTSGLLYGEFDSRLLRFNATSMGFFGATPTTRPNITGSSGGNVALQSLLSGLSSVGLITNSTS
jgi:hypothetical protein